MKNLQNAINELRNGNETNAWNIAKTDTGINNDVTKEQWLNWAYKTESYNEKRRESWIFVS